MSRTTLSDRRMALENHFFHKLEKENILALRSELAKKKSKEELKQASGIEDSKLLDALVNLDVGASDIAALSLVPLIQVAWADNNMSSEEQEAILAAAVKQHIQEGSHSYMLLTEWLCTKPNPELFQAWSDYVSQLREELDASNLTQLQESIVGLAHDVASAAGGLMGIGSVSKPEKAVLSSISAAFEK